MGCPNVAQGYPPPLPTRKVHWELSSCRSEAALPSRQWGTAGQCGGGQREKGRAHWPPAVLERRWRPKLQCHAQHTGGGCYSHSTLANLHRTQVSPTRRDKNRCRERYKDKGDRVTWVATLWNSPTLLQGNSRSHMRTPTVSPPMPHPPPHSQLSPLIWACPWCSEAHKTLGALVSRSLDNDLHPPGSCRLGHDWGGWGVSRL